MSDSEMDNRQAEETSSQREEKEESSPAGASSRRAFIRKTAEVAALSLFGLTAIDPLVEKILRCMEEMSSMRSLARSTGDLLHEAGIGAMAFADAGCNCPGQPTPFSCVNNTSQPYTCPTNFTCTQPQTGLGFQCYVASFYCSRNGTPPNFACAAPQFYCEGGYLCPSQQQFYTGCAGATVSNPWSCSSFEYNVTICSSTTPYVCSIDYTCPGISEFYCQGVFGCPTIFKCDQTGSLDFGCKGSQYQCSSGFTCQNNHVFNCFNTDGTANTGFYCGAMGFQCSAGGSRCGFPETSNYDPTGGGASDTPGDFLCYGRQGGSNFQCPVSFSCKGMAADFACYWNNAFQCNSPFGGCQPNPNTGRFQCNDATGYFTCTPNPPNSFNCDPTTTYSPILT